ncbi:MAG: type II secretion system protein GspM [Thermodesulfobacteriota bacterium]|nr:type II secretion system protein GspM [Thermodesulfobacteriota bacterium]
MNLDKLKNLNQREKYAVYAASVLIALFIVIQFIIFPLINKRDRLTRTLQAQRKTLEEMRLLQSEYGTIRETARLSKKRFEARKKDFTLFSFLDRLADKSGIKNHISYMKPSTSDMGKNGFKVSKVEMKLQGITLKQLTSYLHGVETSRNVVSITRISIVKTGGKERYINAILQIETAEI